MVVGSSPVTPLNAPNYNIFQSYKCRCPCTQVQLEYKLVVNKLTDNKPWPVFTLPVQDLGNNIIPYF